VFFFESDDGVVDATTLYITRPNKTFLGSSEPLLVSAEVVFGKVDDGLNLLIYESSRLEVNELGGFTSEVFEDLEYFSFLTTVNSDERDFSTTHAVINTGTTFSIHLKFLQGYLDEDIDEIVGIFMAANYKAYGELRVFGDILSFEVLDLNATSLIGDRLILNVA